MDTMEVDSSDLDGSRGLDDPDPEEPSTPDERMFDMDSPFLDRERSDEEPIKAIRWANFLSSSLQCTVEPEENRMTKEQKGPTHDPTR